MSAQGCDARDFHTADTAADNCDFLGTSGFDDFVFFALHRLRVKGAASHTGVVRKGLVVADELSVVAFVGSHIEAGVVAADAGVNRRDIVVHKLGYPCGIGKELTSNAQAVDFAFGDCFRANVGFHTAGAHDGNVNEFFDVSDVIEVAVLRHIGTGVSPVPGVVCAVVAVEHIVAGVLEIFCGSFAFFHIAADLNVVFAGKRAFAESFGFGNDGISQRNGEVVAARLFDGFNDFDGEAVSVFKRSAVFVRPLVGVFHRELVKKVAFVNGVDFNAVDARVHAEFRGFCESLDHFVDFFLSKGARDAGFLPSVGGCACACGKVTYVKGGFQDGCKGFVV
ncbi:unknown [Clostridium sp. CAG:349]|nr:unknown [Clostridium sp. CAG:349]